MPITPKAWANRPSALAPNAGESLAEWETRVAAYAAANPGVLTPADAAAMIDVETRLGAYADSVSTAVGDGLVTAVKVAASLKPSGTALTTDEALRALGTAAG